MAEGVGFEPTDPCRSSVFKTDALDQLCDPSVTEVIIADNGVLGYCKNGGADAFGAGLAQGACRGLTRRTRCKNVINQ